MLSRIVPLPFAGDVFPEESVKAVAGLTHNDPAATSSAWALHRIALAMLKHQSLTEAVALVAEQTGAEGMPSAHREYLNLALILGVPLPPTYLATGALGHAVRAAVSTHNFEKALHLATMDQSHDARVVGALAGFLCGLQLSHEPQREPDFSHPAARPSGVQFFPRSWLDRLEGREVVERMAADLVRVFTPGYRVDPDIEARFPGY